MKNNQHDSLPCAHYLSKYLPIPENWIYKVITNHTKFRPVILTRKKENLALFPISQLYSLDDFTKIRQYMEILLSKVLGYFILFKNLCFNHNVKILHVHFGYQGVKMIGLKKKLKIPMLCSFYGDDAFAYTWTVKNNKGYKRLFKEADKILVLGVYMKKELVKLGCPESKISVHHLGIDVDKIRFTQRKIVKGGKIRFLIASSFVQKKGIDLAIRALAHFRDGYDFSLDLLGDGILRDTIMQEIEDSGIKDRITWHGYKPYSDFINLAYVCDVFIQASRTTEQNNKEGTPMAIVDAMATGMIVISTRHSDIPEIVIDGENGYLAEENDIASLRNCIQKVFDNPDELEAFSLKGREWIEKEFDAKIQTAKLEEYYAELIQAKFGHAINNWTYAKR